MCGCAYSYAWHNVEASGHLHIPRALPLGKARGIQNLIASLDIGEGKYLLPTFGIKLWFVGGPPHSQVSILTEIPLL
jgi:hypothetical protein